MYCICTKGNAGYTAMHEKDAKGNPDPLTMDYSLWVCSGCMRPSRMVFEKETGMLAPSEATAILSSKGFEDGTFVQRWRGLESGSRIETMSFKPQLRGPDMQVDHGRNHLIAIWEKMDRLIDTIRGDGALPTDYEKAQCTAYADVVAQIMHQFYEDSTAVLAELMVRWKARQAGEEHESPGLAERFWQPPTTTGPARSGGASVPAAPAFKPIEDTKVNFIKHCLAAGLQSAEALAKMMEISIEQVESYRD